MIKQACVVLLLTLVPVLAAAQGSGETGKDVQAEPPKITNPEWKRIPNAARLYPLAAMQRDVEGQATIQCIIGEKGVLTACKALSEAPVGYGFGKAGVEASKNASVKAPEDKTVPFVGRTIEFNLNWRIG